MIPRRPGRTSAACASSPRRTACASSRWERARTTASRLTRAPRTCGSARRFSEESTGPRSNILREMGFADVWNKTLVYFGIAEEEEWDEDGYLTDEDLQRAYAERPNVRRLAPRRREREF